MLCPRQFLFRLTEYSVPLQTGDESRAPFPNPCGDNHAQCHGKHGWVLLDVGVLRAELGKDGGSSRAPLLCAFPEKLARPHTGGAWSISRGYFRKEEQLSPWGFSAPSPPHTISGLPRKILHLLVFPQCH